MQPPKNFAGQDLPPQYVPSQPVVIVDVTPKDVQKLGLAPGQSIGPVTITQIISFPGSPTIKNEKSKLCGRVSVLFKFNGGEEVTEASLASLKNALKETDNLIGKVTFIQPTGIEEVMQVSPSAFASERWAYDAVKQGFGEFPPLANPVRVVVVDTGVNGPGANVVGAEMIAPKNFVYWNPGTNRTDTDFSPTAGTNYLSTKPEHVLDDYAVTRNGQSLSGHGTQIAGIIAAPFNPTTKLGGVAPGAQIVPVKACDKNGLCTSISVAQGICHALDAAVNAKIVNLSLGYLDGNDPTIKLAIEDVTNAGVVVVAAGGNIEVTKNNPLYPAALSKGDDGKVAVGAIEPNPGGATTYATLSNTGEYIDIVAPGRNVAALSPTGGIVSVDGTSLATAFVSGAAAQIISRNENLKPSEIEAKLAGNKGKCGKGNSGSATNPSCGKGVLQIEASIPLSGVLNVEKFGAKSNDGLDDTAAMQEAADAICKSAPGSTLVYPPGVYHINKVLTDAQAYSNNPREYTIVYENCHDVTISGYGAKIDVKGDFIKGVLGNCVEDNPATPENESRPRPDKHGFIPFSFSGSYRFTMKGFEIDGNVDQMRVSDPSRVYCDGREYGIVVNGPYSALPTPVPENPFPNFSFDLIDLHVHHMAQDGIYLSSSRNVTLERVWLDKNAENGLHLVQVQNVEVVDSKVTDTGQDSGPGDSFFRRSINVEMIPVCGPEDADWPVLNCPNYPLSGNILFDRVEISGGRGAQLVMANGHQIANVTIRNSTIRVAGDQSGSILLGVTGGLIENSTIDNRFGTIDPCFGYFDRVKQYNSPIFQKYLNLLADDNSPIAQKIYRERRPTFATRIENNVISGKGLLLFCQGTMPELQVLKNTFIGQHDASSAANGPYGSYRSIFIAPTKLGFFGNPAVNYTPFARVADNSFFIPQTIPIIPGDPVPRVAIFYDQVELARNRFTTDGTTAPLKITYDHVKSVSQDRFPADGSIAPIRGPRYAFPPFNDPPDYPAYQTYTLVNGILNFP